MPQSSVAKPLRKVVFAWLASVLLYGWYDVSEIMASLSVAPSPDLYANELGFQVLAFVLTKGLASVILLGIVLLGVASIGHKSNLSVEKAVPPNGQE